MGGEKRRRTVKKEKGETKGDDGGVKECVRQDVYLVKVAEMRCVNLLDG